jgi:hypothetical protein
MYVLFISLFSQRQGKDKKRREKQRKRTNEQSTSGHPRPEQGVKLLKFTTFDASQHIDEPRHSNALLIPGSIADSSGALVFASSEAPTGSRFSMGSFSFSVTVTVAVSAMYGTLVKSNWELMITTQSRNAKAMKGCFEILRAKKLTL